MIINIQDMNDWRSMTALHQSLKFYNDNNKDGKYSTAIKKETRMLSNYLSKVKENTLADTACADAA